MVWLLNLKIELEFGSRFLMIYGHADAVSILQKTTIFYLCVRQYISDYYCVGNNEFNYTKGTKD